MLRTSFSIFFTLFIGTAAMAAENAQNNFDFDGVDTNGDGYMTEAEWQDAAIEAPEFSVADANSDGYVDVNEAESALTTQRRVQAASPDPGHVTPEENYKGTGYDPLAVDPTDEGLVAKETEAAASGGIDREVRADVADRDRAKADKDGEENGDGTQVTPADAEDAFITRGRDAEQSLRPLDVNMSQLDANNDGRISREEAEQDRQTATNFVAWDSNQNGYLNEQELKQGRSAPDASTGTGMQSLSRQVSLEEEDADNDGRISEQEAPQNLDFETVDMNNDGYLDEAEVQYEPGERTLADAAEFDQYDADDDGRLSQEEAANDTYLSSNFDAWDSNQDGYLEEAEVNNGWLEETSATPDEIW